MAISFVAAGAVQLGANPTVPVPSGIAQYDLLLLFVSTTAVAVTLPTGWTIIQSTEEQVWCAYKIAEASESSVAVSTTGTDAKSVMLAYRGAANINAIAVAGTSGTQVPSKATNTFTTTVDSTVVVSYFAISSTNCTFTAPSGTTSRVFSNANTAYRGLLIVDEVKATAGTTTARTASFSIDTYAFSEAFAIAATNSKGDFFSVF